MSEANGGNGNVKITSMNELQANHPDSRDIGPIGLRCKRDETHIHLEFGKPVEWVRLTPDVARSTARQLVMLADAINEEQTCVTPPDKD